MQNSNTVISLKKGERISLDKDGVALKDINVGLGWDVKMYDGGSDYDLDASAFLVSKDPQTGREYVKDPNTGFVFYGQGDAYKINNPVTHSGDNRTGVGEGDDETIHVSLDKIAADISKVSLVVTIYEADARKQNFGQVESAFVRIVDNKTNKEICRYDLSEEFSNQTAMIVGSLNRDPKNPSVWKFRAEGNGYNRGLEGICEQYGISTSSNTPQYTPPPAYAPHASVPVQPYFGQPQPSAPVQPSFGQPYQPNYMQANNRNNPGRTM